MTGPEKKLAVIGLGPRGTGALEALADLASARGLKVQAEAFDPCPAPGAGPNFDPSESPLCRLNIPMRDIDLRAPDSLGVVPLADWLDPPIDRDVFPARADLGAYLQHRLDALSAAPGLALTRIPARIDALQQSNEGWQVQADGTWHGPYAEVLLVPGQPETEPDDQLAEWQSHSDATDAALCPAYPARDLQQRAGGWRGKTVAVRGFALSSFDVIRVLTQGLGGTYTEQGYVPSGREPRCILPFSLDGQPPSPKPETEELDARFEPTAEETAAFASAIHDAAQRSAAQARTRITESLRPPVQRILAECGAETTEQAISDWFDLEWTDPGTQDQTGPVQALRDGIAMADGSLSPSIGYVVGQVWRKWQNPLRQGYNPADIPPDTADLLIGFDEGLKRYSYGPPVSACRELLALIDARLVSADLSRDPEITLTEKGWLLKTEGHKEEAEVMIDAVLPSPDPRLIKAQPVPALIEAGRITMLGGLSARTAPDGRLIGSDGQPVPGLSLLGRLALGSVIAVDSLHDCFGMASTRWAEGVLGRMG